jgi:hypothetical protein
MMVFDLMGFALRAVEETEPVHPTVDPADIRGFMTTSLASVGCLPRSRHEDACRSRHAVEGDTTPGRHLFQGMLEPAQLNSFAVWVQSHDRTYAWKTVCCAGVGQTTSENHLRWAGPQVARPSYQIS